MADKKKQWQNVTISTEVHKILLDHIDKIDGKIYKFVEKAIKEKIERDTR